MIRTIAAQHINYLDRFWDLYQQLPYETARYVPRFLATLLVIRDPQKYGMDLETGVEKAPILSYEVVEINKCMRLQDIARKLETPEEPLNILNAELRHRLTPDRPYKLKVPLEMAEQLLKAMDEIPQSETPRSASVSMRAVLIRHKIRQGETLETIAKKYRTSVAAIRTCNNFTNKQQIGVGTQLKVPIQTGKRIESPNKAQKGEKSVKHSVQKGDTLASLARKYDTTVAEIKKSNRLTGDKLRSGQIIRIQRDNEELDQAEKRDKNLGKKGKTTAKAPEGKGHSIPANKKYTVKKGDSLNKIARENNVSLEKLLELNKLALKENIRPGQVILIK